MDDQVASNNFEGYQKGLKDEEIIASGDSKGFVNVPPSEADEGRRDRQVGHHLRHTYGFAISYMYEEDSTR